MPAATYTQPAPAGAGWAARRYGVIERPALEWNEEVRRETDHLYERVRHHIPQIEWPFHAPYIAAINRLKAERGAVILAHNYQTPEIFHCVADIVGDSLQLAKEATRVDADIIVQCGVHFMAETSKLLNPDKTVLIPDMKAGCSLSESITGADVRLLRERYRGVPIVTYVNTSAEVKAESDICCTSSNAVQVVESFGVDTVLCIPDEYLAQNVAAQTDVKILTWKGHCEVHERFTAEELQAYKDADPEIEIIAHPECPTDVVEMADYAGSTAGMINYVRDRRPPKVLLVTECSMASNVQSEVPEVEFVKPCNLCPHMKRITLPKILDSLCEMKQEVTVDPAIAERARRAVERMVNLRADGEFEAVSVVPVPHRNVSPSNRSNARRMRRGMTDAERKLWQELRAHRLMGLGFRRQMPISGFIVDFACPEHRLIVELDGSQHGLSTETIRDQQRDARLNALGWQVLRFWNDDVFGDIDGVCRHIVAVIDQSRHA